MRFSVNRVKLFLLLSCVLSFQSEGLVARAEFSAIPSDWTVTTYGDSSQVLLPGDINNEGVAVGALQKPDGFVPVQLADGEITILGDGTVPGFAEAINDQGVIVGYNLYPDGRTVAAIYSPGSSSELNDGVAWGLDDAGTIVGEVNNVAAYWPQGGSPLALPALLEGQTAQVLAINENGWMAGEAVGPHWSSTDQFADHAVLWRDGQIVDLGSVVEGNSIAIDLNDQGTVVGLTKVPVENGTDQPDYTYSSFTWQDGVITPLPFAEGETSCFAASINELGWIVGECGTGDGQHAVVWVDGKVMEVNDLLGTGWTSTTTSGVNDVGQIIGQGLFNGVLEVFVLTPEGQSSDCRMKCWRLIV